MTLIVNPDVASTTWEYEPADLQPDWRAAGLVILLLSMAVFWAGAWWLFLS